MNDHHLASSQQDHTMPNNIIEILRHHETPQTVLARKYPKFAPFDIQAAIEYAKRLPDSEHIVPFVVGAGLNTHHKAIHWYTNYSMFRYATSEHMGYHAYYPATTLRFSTGWVASLSLIRATHCDVGLALTFECGEFVDGQVSPVQLYVGTLCNQLEHVHVHRESDAYLVQCTWQNIAQMCLQLESFLMDETVYNKTNGPGLLVQAYAQSVWGLSAERLRICHEENYHHLLLDYTKTKIESEK